MSLIRYLYIYTETIACIIGSILNIFLIFAIQQSGDPELGKYNRMLLQQVFIDLWFIIMNFIIRPIIVPYYPVLIIVINAIFPTDRWWSFLLANIGMCAILYCMGAMCILFYFRYRILCLGQSFSLKRQFLCLIIAAMGVVVTFVIHCYTYINMTDDTVQHAEKIVSSFERDQEKTRVTVVYKFPEHYIFLLILESSAIAVISYIVVLWCSWKIYKYLDQQNVAVLFGENFHKIQTQITRTLIAQALVPLLFVMVPYWFLLFNLFVPVHFFTPEVASLSVIMYSYIPVGNALSIIIFVPAYREQGLASILKVFRKVIRRGSKESVTQSATVVH